MLLETDGKKILKVNCWISFPMKFYLSLKIDPLAKPTPIIFTKIEHISCSADA
jgi:hypothetical protein